MRTPFSVAAAHSQPWPRYQWPEGYGAAFCFTVDVDSESVFLWSMRDQPDSRLVGQMEQRLFGPRIGIWRLLDLLDRAAMKASFFVPGVVAENHPDLLPALVARGHEVGLHGYFHEIVSQSSDGEFVAALDAAIALFQQQIGFVPNGFRSPAWEMTPVMLREIRDRGFYDSSLMGFDHPYSVEGLVEVPVQWMIDDAIYFKFSGQGQDMWPPSAPGPILEGWRDELAFQRRDGGLFMLTVHDWISGRGQRIVLLEKLLADVAAAPEIWTPTAGELAAYHAASINKDRFDVPVHAPDDIGKRRFGRTP